MAIMSGGQAVVKALINEGIDVVFGVPGVQIMHIYDGFFNQSDIDVISCRHEQTTVYMADGYARSTGKIGVALVVPGPGAYNAGAAMSTAYATSSPVVLISGQIDSNAIGKDFGALHEIENQLGFMSPVVKWNDMVNKTEAIPEIIHRAIQEVSTGRPRPVEIEIPPDILANEQNIEFIEKEIFSPLEPDVNEISKAIDVIMQSKKPVIWVGGGANLSDCSTELLELAESLKAPVITTAEGKGAIPESHPLNMGTSSYGFGPSKNLIPESDVMIVIGSRLGSYRPETGSVPHENMKLININIDPNEIGKTYNVDVGIVSDAKTGLQAILAELKNKSYKSNWDSSHLEKTKNDYRSHLLDIAPRQVELLQSIRNVLPKETFVVSGVTNMGSWSSIALDMFEPRTFITSSYMGTLGYAFPTSLGVKVGNPSKPVISLCGDGGFMYGIGELATAVQYGINVVTVVFNNNRYGASNKDQNLRFKGRTVGTELHNPDFVQLAESFGVKGIKVDSLDESSKAIESALEMDAPVVVEIELPSDLNFPYYINQ